MFGKVSEGKDDAFFSTGHSSLTLGHNFKLQCLEFKVFLLHNYMFLYH